MSTRTHWLRPIDKRITACGRNSLRADVFAGSAAEYLGISNFCVKCEHAAQKTEALSVLKAFGTGKAKLLPAPQWPDPRPIAEREHTENQELRNLLSPLRDAVLYARAQRRPLGIGAASDKAPTSTTLRLGVQFGRERHADGFWIECDELGPQDKDNPNPATRIAVELLRLAYAIADKVRT